MSAQEQEVIDFVNKIPSSENPYLVMVPVIQNLIKPPPAPRWSINLQKAILGAFVLMFLQSCFLLYQRIRCGSFLSFKYNKLGLLLVNVSDFSGCLYFIYTALTIVDLSLRQADERGSNHYGPETLLFGSKFLPILSCGWAFLWLCGLQCASILIEKAELRYSNKNLLDGIRRVLRWLLIIIFLFGLLVSYFIVIWAYANACHEYLQMSEIVASIRDSLDSKSKEYRKESYNKFSLLLLLAPARALIQNQSRMEFYVDTGIKVFLAAVLFASIISIPLLPIPLRALFNESVPQVAVRAEFRTSEGEELKAKTSDARRARRRLVLHALALYASVLTHLPTLVWQVLNNKPGFLKSSHWQTVTVLGLHIPFSITGNLVMLVLNINASSIPMAIVKNAINPGKKNFKPSKTFFRRTVSPEKLISVTQGRQIFDDYNANANKFSDSATKIQIDYVFETKET